MHRNYHKCDVFVLHIFPILSKDLYDFGAFTLHSKIAKSPTEINKKWNIFQKCNQAWSLSLHVKPTDFNDFGRFGGSPLSKEFNDWAKNFIIAGLGSGLAGWLLLGPLAGWAGCAGLGLGWLDWATGRPGDIIYPESIRKSWVGVGWAGWLRWLALLAGIDGLVWLPWCAGWAGLKWNRIQNIANTICWFYTYFQHFLMICDALSYNLLLPKIFVFQ